MSTQAAKKLREALEIFAESKSAMMLRILQTIHDAAEQDSTTVVLPIPIEILEYLRRDKGKE